MCERRARLFGLSPGRARPTGPAPEGAAALAGGVAKVLAVLTCLLASGPVRAFDAHGRPAVAGQAEVAAPLTLWPTWTAPQGTWAAGTLLEYAASPLVEVVEDDSGSTRQPLLDDLLSLQSFGSYGLSQHLGLALTAPVYLYATGQAAPDGPAAGDVQLALPWGLVHKPAASLGIVTHVVLPTGRQDSFLGSTGPGGGLTLTAGWRRSALSLTGNLGAELLPGDTLQTMDSGFKPFVGGAASLLLAEDLAAVAEASSTLGPWTADAQYTAASSELRLSANIGLPRAVLRLGTATALASGPGSASYRLFAGITWHRPPEPGDLTPVTDAPAAVEQQVVVTVVDSSGQPLAAELLLVASGAEPASTRLGPDGVGALNLRPGSYELSVEADGQGTQRRQVVVEESPQGQARITVVLLPEVATDAQQLHLRVVDPLGLPVEGARVRIDGQDVGTISTGGTLALESLTRGPHQVLVDADDFDAARPMTVALAPDSDELLVQLLWPPGSVKVVARTPEGRVSDAIVRMFGPDVLPPEELGPQGERMFVLAPGAWQVVVSSGNYGLQQRDVVIERDQADLVVVDVVLNPSEKGKADLQVRVVDPDGQPVEGALVLLDGKLVGSTSNAGSLTLSSLSTGTRSLDVRGDRFLPRDPIAVELVPGLREVAVPLLWKPGSLKIDARGPDGVGVDAQVRFYGPQSVEPDSLGPSGRGFFELPPGAWTVVLSAEELGIQRREVVIEPGATSLVEINAVFGRAEAGAADLNITVVDAEGRPVDGARILLDEVDHGATSTGGTLKLEGLRPGGRKIEVVGSSFQPWSKTGHGLGPGPNELNVQVQLLTGDVNVVVRDPEGAPLDAQVRCFGPKAMPPIAVGADGERLFALDPGAWAVVASSDLYGIQQQDTTVAAGQDPVTLRFDMHSPQANTAQLVLQVVDGDGLGVAGAVVRVGSRVLTTAEGGQVVLEGLDPGGHTFQVSAAGYKGLTERGVKLVAGPQSRTLELDWIDQVVTFEVRTDQGQVVPAELSFLGPLTVDPVTVGRDGRASVTLRPGTWGVVASAPELGARRQDFRLQAGQKDLSVAIELKDTRVEVTTQEVVINEKINFDFGRSTISPESMPLIEEVANNLLLHPEIKLVEVQGHTDNVGSEAFNQELSQRRAEAVRAALVAQQVSGRILVARGYGTSVPLATNDTEEGRAQNRRVQFEILTTSPAAAPKAGDKASDSGSQ